MHKKPSIKDVAQEAGVGTTSVARFLSPKQRMELSEETRQKIETAILKLGYLPNPYMRKHRARGVFTLGILTSLSKDIFHSRYHTEILSGIFDRIRIGETSHRLTFILLADREYSRLEEILYSNGLDGLFILTWRIHPSVVRLVEGSTGDLPLVIFNDFDPRVKVSIVYADVRAGMRKAVNYLFDRGYKEIGILRGPSQILFKDKDQILKVPSIDAEEKLQGYLEEMKRHGENTHTEWIRECGSYNEKDGFQAMAKWIEEEKLPQAIVCANDEIALGALNALKQTKIWVPEKMALMGFDGIEKAELVSPRLSTVKQPLYQMGYEAVDILIDRVQFPYKKPIQRRYEPELAPRQTA